MSAAEIIEQIKVLPKDDFRAVAKFIDEVRRNEDAAVNPQDQVRPGFQDVARKVFDRYDDLFRELAK
jgi:hypothetical protein